MRFNPNSFRFFITHILIRYIDPVNAASRKILLNNGFVSEKKGVIDGLPSEIFGLSV